MTYEALAGVLLVAVAITGAIALGIYTLVTPWWRSRAGRAYFALFGSLILVVWHFVTEAIWGQRPAWVECILIGIVLAAILFNIATALRKQILGYRKRRIE